MRALDLGMHVCIVENGRLGGAGVMWGALASKTMWELAKDYAIASRNDRGYSASEMVVDYRAVRKTVFQAVREKQHQMMTQLKAFSPGSYRGPGSITLKRGLGSFLSNSTFNVTARDGRIETFTARHFLIATGSKPRSFPGVEVDQKKIFDSDGILRLTSFPKRLLIIGAGIIGCEYASIFSNFSQTKVTLVDHAERIIPFEDEDVSDFVSRNLINNGVKIIHSAKLKGIDREKGRLAVALSEQNGETRVVETDAVLLSIGRKPDLSRLNLEAAGIEADERGFLPTDSNCCVQDNVYAAGDVTRHPALVNLAEAEARYAVKAMKGVNRWPLNYTNMSTVMFFYPAVAAVGMNEKMCRQKKIPYRVARYSNAFLARAIAMRATNGFVKIIVSDDDQERILGMRASGPQVSNTIMSIAMLMDQDTGLKEALKSVHPHPTMSEGIQECLRLLSGKSIYKDSVFPENIAIRSWAP